MRDGKTMKRWRWQTWLLACCLLFLGVALGLLESQRILSGWIRGEAFYKGRPTSYWREALYAEREAISKKIGPKPYFWESTPVRDWLPKSRSIFSEYYSAAIPVLKELSTDQDEVIRYYSCVTLVIIRMRENDDLKKF